MFPKTGTVQGVGMGGEDIAESGTWPANSRSVKCNGISLLLSRIVWTELTMMG